MRDLQTIELGLVSAGIGANTIVGAALGGLVGMLPGYPVLGLAFDISLFPTGLVVAPLLLLEATYPYIIAGVCIGGIAGLYVDYYYPTSQGTDV